MGVMNFPWRLLTAMNPLLQRRLSTSSHLLAHHRIPKRKPIVFKKSLIAPIDVWDNMAINDLSKVSGKSIDDIFGAICFLENSAAYTEEKDKLHKDDLKRVLQILGLKGKLGPPPVTVKFEEVKEKKATLDAVPQPPPPESQLKPRRPVVTVMGHVDHGKTTLLDTLRKSSVVDQEAGGITQHIGAFSVKVPICNLGAITFLDTPGHAAFSAMRARGANVTDMVVLVVAADDGVMEQTVESIRFANEAQVPIIVAINKMDKPGVNPEHTKKGLLSYGIQSDAEGGDVQFVPISALKGDGMDLLLEAIVLQGELLDLKSTFEGLAEGFIIESLTHEHRGKLSTLLVKRGTVRKGNILVAGTAWCKVRSIFDEWGKPLQHVEPGCAAQVTGWRSLPRAGDLTLQVESEQRAREVMQIRERIHETEKLTKVSQEIEEKATKEREVYIQRREALRAQGYLSNKRNRGVRPKEVEDDDHPALNVVIKGDTDGSVEALLDILETYDKHDDCRLEILHYGVGPVTITDLEFADNFNGVVYAMHVGALPEAKAAAKKDQIKQFRVIYKLVEDVKEEISKRLPEVDAEEVIGEAKVLQEFLINEKKKKIPVAGCRCVKGDLLRSETFKVLRNEEVIYTGSLASMKHMKSEVKSIKTNVECGLMLEDPNVRFQEGDVIQCIRKFKTSQKTAWTPRGF